MSLRKEHVFISEGDYLRCEHYADIKHEYIDGQIYAMVGASANHNHLSLYVSSRIRTHLEKTPCDVFQSDFKVKVGTKYFYPDVVVRCDKEDNYYTEKPLLIVEVLSSTTIKYDRSFKLAAYKQIPSLVEYVMIGQDSPLVEVYRRTNEGWDYMGYVIGDDAHLKSIDLTFSIEELYSSIG